MNSKNTRIGLGLFFNNTTNSGIVNYIYNIIAALHSLPREEQPEVVLLHNETAEIKLIEQIGYAKLKLILVKRGPGNFFYRKLNALLLKVTGKNYFLQRHVYSQIDCFYPYFPFVNGDIADAPNKIEWLVDFNNRAFPDFYEDKGKSMLQYQEELTRRTNKIVLSSNTLLEELKQYYPGYRNEVKILRFACSLPSIDEINEQFIMENHGIYERYFMSPNQFWEHKNQIVVLKAIQQIKTSHPHIRFKVLFTGSLTVNRGKGLYAEKLVKLIDDLDLSAYVQVLGIVERREQLFLMKKAVALIQPSLYEGWSTLVEEAKALNKFIILSDIPVHKEQISINCRFFDPANDAQLADIMVSCLNDEPAASPNDYGRNIREYGYDILKALV